MSKDDRQIELLHRIISEKDTEINLYKQELFKISHQLDVVLAQINSDVDALKKIQKVLVPTEIPNIPGFEFSKKFVYGTKTGGDYFDIFEHEDKFKFGLILSSASGYGMSAIFLSCILKHTHMMSAKKGMSAEVLVSEIAQELKSLGQPKDHVHLFYGIMNRRDLSLDFCAAGRITGLLQTPNKPLRLLKSDSGPIGPAFDAHFTLAHVDFEPLSRLILVSDGLLDVFSVDELSSIVTKYISIGSVHDVRNEILLQAQIKTGLDNPTRDQTVVVVEVKDKVIKLAKS